MVKLTLYRRSGSDGVSPAPESLDFPQAKMATDIRVKSMPDGTTILVGPTRTYGLGPNIERWELLSEADDDAEPAPGTPFVFKFNKQDMAILERAMSHVAAEVATDPDEERAIKRLMRLMARKRGRE